MHGSLGGTINAFTHVVTSRFQPRRLIRRALLSLLLLAAALSGCLPEAGQEGAATATATAVPTPAPTATPVPTPQPTATPTPGPLTPSAIFTRISPAIAYVETATCTGSGVLIHDGYLVTNAHVVWPFDTVRVFFANGDEFEQAPVVNVDLMADLAIVGPLETDLVPLELVDGEHLAAGSSVYLIGFPDEVETYPQPSMTQGILSRTREWEQAGISFLQTDAAISGGQSGGVLVSDRAEVIGISGFVFSDFGLVTSTGDIAPRIERLIAGEDTAGLGDRRPDMEQAGITNDTAVLSHDWSMGTYTFTARPDHELRISVSSDGDLGLIIVNASGMFEAFVDNTFSGVEQTTFRPAHEGIYYVSVLQYDVTPHSYTLSSSEPLIKLNDPDDERSLSRGDIVAAAIDFPGDYDVFNIELRRDELLYVLVDSSLIDPEVTIDFLGAHPEESVTDDDSGGGIFGRNAELTYRAPRDGSYQIVVSQYYPSAAGGYVLTVDAPGAAAPTPMAPAPTPVPVQTAAGEMNVYVGELAPFYLEYPASLQRRVPDDPYLRMLCYSAEDCYYDGQLMLIIMEEDLEGVATLLGDLTLDDYAAYYREQIALVPNAEMGPDERIITAAGEALVLNCTMGDGRLTIRRMLFLHEDAALNVNYIVQDLSALLAEGSASVELLEFLNRDVDALIDYSFGSLHLAE